MDVKRCTSCGKEQPLDEFYRVWRDRDVRQPRCKMCQRKKVREWQQANPEKHRAHVREDYRRHKEKRLAYRQAWAELNQDSRRKSCKKWRDENHAQARGAESRWQAANPEKRASYKARRRASERVDAVPFNRTAIYERDNGRCHICGKHVPQDKFELDHLVPLSRGGSHTPENVAVAHSSCNRSRGAGRLDAQLLLIG